MQFTFGKFADFQAIYFHVLWIIGEGGSCWAREVGLGLESDTNHLERIVSVKYP